MTTWGARSSQRPLTSDIGAFVEKYQKLADLLFPFTAASDAVLYVVRWQSYLLTLAVLVSLSVLIYYPALLVGCLTLLAIAALGVGRYYKQTRPQSLAKLRQNPRVEHLDQDQQDMKRHEKEQKNSRKMLVEYRNIMQSVEHFMVVISEILQYIYSIIFWDSPEVSLCVTMLLCALFGLVSTIPLRTIAACLPVLVLCSSKHFFRRTLDIWRKVWNIVYTRLKRLKWKQKKRKKKEGDEKQNEDDAQTHTDSSAATGTADSTVLSNGAATMQDQAAADGTSNDSDDVRTKQSVDSCSSTQPSAAQGSASSAGTTSGLPGSTAASGTVATGRGSPKPISAANKKELLKGFCTKCQVSFAKLLKRKHDCNYCGQCFCGSCSVKVKRALLGATSPAAFEESVRVCVDCKEKLDNLPNLVSQLPAADRGAPPLST